MSSLAEIAERLVRLETRVPEMLMRLRQHDDVLAIRQCVTRYMELCDKLDASSPLAELLDCFTEDASWAGKGARYGASFGGFEGRAEIGEMFSRYMGTPPHFALNVHFLTSEEVTVTNENAARASWVMLQASTFASGESHLNAARLGLDMVRCADGRWRIARFETENLFSRPIGHWQSDAVLPVPPVTGSVND